MPFALPRNRRCLLHCRETDGTFCTAGKPPVPFPMLLIFLCAQKEALKSNFQIVSISGLLLCVLQWTENLRAVFFLSFSLDFLLLRSGSLPGRHLRRHRFFLCYSESLLKELDSEPMTFCSLSTSNFVLFLYCGVLGFFSLLFPSVIIPQVVASGSTAGVVFTFRMFQIGLSRRIPASAVHHFYDLYSIALVFVSVFLL